MIPQERRLVIGFGALSGLCRFVEIRGAHRAPISRTITRVAQIFSNSLQLIDKFERDPLTGLHNRQSVRRFDRVSPKKPEPKEYSTSVIDNADNALYYAKDNGRNKVVGYAATFDA